MPELVTIALENYGTREDANLLNRRWFDISKRVLDITLGGLALILLFPVMVFCGLIIKLSSKGPVVYKQVRVGKDGKLFSMYKLRTMYDNAEARTGAIWAQDNDPRVIWSCRWMRRGHFDELPQLINVLTGEMSLVGPRPERPEIMSKLENIFPNIHRRLSVKPGITGLAQVRNGYDTTIESTRLKLDRDLEYISCRSWSLELRILIETLPKFNDKSAR